MSKELKDSIQIKSQSHAPGNENTGNQHSDTPQNIDAEHQQEHPAFDEPAGGHEEEVGIFKQLLNENLGDHSQLSFFDVLHIDLPKIIIDDGLHLYSSDASMHQAGVFTTEHHQIVRTSDHQPPTLDMSITSLVVFEWFAIIFLFILFRIAGKRYKKSGDAPKGIQNLVEFYVNFVKESIVRPNVVSDRLTNSLTPYFIGLFFFILVMNLSGLIPGGHSPTGNISVTAGLAVTAFLVINVVAIREIGVGAYFKHLLGGAPVALSPIMIPIEILSMFVKPFALTIRLFANMTAGHVILLCLVGLIFFFKSWIMPMVSVPFSLFIYLLEFLVGFIQAYVFTILTAVFVGLALGDHAHEDHSEPELQH